MLEDKGDPVCRAIKESAWSAPLLNSMYMLEMGETEDWPVAEQIATELSATDRASQEKAFHEGLKQFTKLKTSCRESVLTQLVIPRMEQFLTDRMAEQGLGDDQGDSAKVIELAGAAEDSPLVILLSNLRSARRLWPSTLLDKHLQRLRPVAERQSALFNQDKLAAACHEVVEDTKAQQPEDIEKVANTLLETYPLKPAVVTIACADQASKARKLFGLIGSWFLAAWPRTSVVLECAEALLQRTSWNIKKEAGAEEDPSFYMVIKAAAIISFSSGAGGLPCNIPRLGINCQRTHEGGEFLNGSHKFAPEHQRCRVARRR